MRRQIFAVVVVLFFCGELAAEIPAELRLGRANHAFDHLGGIGLQAEAAAASGSTIIYATGIGSAAYSGLPSEKEFKTLCDETAAYNRNAKAHGIELSIGYLCATSIVKLDMFDKNWTDEFRAQFKTKPAEWRQQDRQGKPLASWYGGDYQPACMSNPDWRAYERAMVRHTLETGHGGVFFDNPTVHPQGCYCPHCMDKFAKFLKRSPLAERDESVTPSEKSTLTIEEIRKLADTRAKEFLRFRSTIARDFLADMRTYARSINPNALTTCNNSLNAPSVFYSQARTYGYNIHEMSKVEDLVVVEDMNNQPRIDANGQMLEYGPTYKQLHAISHGKPIVAVTIAGGDYHTPPNLMRLAMAEAVANNASYLSWPTWPQEQRERMIMAVRPQAEFLRRNEVLLNDAPFRVDVALYMQFHRWTETDQCVASSLAATLTKENIQYTVISEGDLDAFAKRNSRPVLVVESQSALTWREQPALATIEKKGPGIITADKPDWLQSVRKAIREPSITAEGAPGIRVVVHDQPNRSIVHIYNLNIQRLSSFEDTVTSARNLKLTVNVPFEQVGEVKIETADESMKAGPMKYNSTRAEDGSSVAINIPQVDIHSIVTIEGGTR